MVLKKMGRLGILVLLFGMGMSCVQPSLVSMTPENVVLAAKKKAKTASKKTEKKQVTLTAIGDSLTYGVGDGANNHGYVGLIQTKLSKSYDSLKVKTHNFGVSGDTSGQILSRVTKDTTLKQAVQQSDAIILTMGGNDIMHVIQKDPTHVTTAAIAKQAQTMGQHLNEVIALLRQYNSDIPIFVFGLYNPFYVLMPTVDTMQTAVHNWNDNTKNVLRMNKQCYFVPVDGVLTKGDAKTQTEINKRLKAVKKEKKQSSATNTATSASDIVGSQGTKGTKKELVNPYLYKKDHFHPNHKGYVRMTQQLSKKMTQYRKYWLYQEK